MKKPLDNLLEQLCSGDQAAAAQVFLMYEPYLRKAVRRHLPPPLRAKFDPADIVQSIWADVLHGFRTAGWRFLDLDHLRGFLFVATRNRLIDRIRHYQKAGAHEKPLGETFRHQDLLSAQPRPSEVAQAEDLWEQMLAHCPTEHRPLLGLRRQGYSLAEIAAQTGLHPDSVRRILRTLARQLAFADQESGVRGQESEQTRPLFPDS
jgi:RNA polymerase sigma-70 factor (ECF subfamily)